MYEISKSGTVLRKIDPDAMVLLLPEGRMKRANGLDADEVAVTAS